ncbi:type I-E CRISPR-associated protein Cse1/CasA [Actinophytocola xinjiangensis]|uniref:type I-E CRISPR-associated protein Cse1/CasA n=1 Tax=Actinophytocola xinjiangensis TaxID=485602 RepID=UPI0013901397|nr:type I-E CRISPR-associated protein Cse1/CasA [Actinophytocola xinjiangensis]
MRPWLLARDQDGDVVELSMGEIFGSAHRLLGLVGDVPTQVFALTRLLLAVLHRSVGGPRDVAAWRELWRAETLPVDDIDRYLQAHRHRFDLADQTEPFFQVAGLRVADGSVSDLSKLIADVPNGAPFFTTRIGGRLTLAAAEAARWLVHCQAFDTSGIKSGDPSDPRTKNGKGYPIGVSWSGHLGGVLVGGRTLRETLLLNLIPRDFTQAADADDRPPWERPQLGAAEEVPGGRAPTGPVELFTWQSRRVRLAWDDGLVTGVLIGNGDRLTPQNMHPFEPHTLWRRSETQEKKLRSSVPVYMPLEHNPERDIWRGLQSMLPDTGAATVENRLTATVLRWVSSLAMRRVLDTGYPLELRAIGMHYGAQSSTVADIVDDALSLRAILFAQDAAALIGSVKQAVEHSEAGANAVGRLAENLAVAAGSRDITGGHRLRATEQAYSVLDPLFRTWLAGLDENTDASTCLAQWHRTALDALRELADDLAATTPPVAWVGRDDRQGRRITSVHARKWCGDALRKTFQYAAPSPSRTPVGS